MAYLNFPTSKDIYIEVNGRRLAVAQSYKAHSTKESKYIEAFGSVEPVGTVGGKMKHVVQLTRVSLCQTAISDNIDFYSLTDFDIVIVQPDRKIIYTGCEWSDISQSAALGDVVLEAVNIVASKRMEIR